MTVQSTARCRTAVIVPAHNEEQVIAATLESIAAAHGLADVFVFCDACSDTTAAIARRFLPAGQVIESAQNIGKSRGIEYMLENVVYPGGYEFVAVIDADTTLRPDFFQQAHHALADDHVAGVTGQVKSRPYTNAFAVYRMFVYAIWQAVFKRLQSMVGGVVIASGCSTVWRVEALRKVTFDHRMYTEDFNLTMQVHRKRLGAIRYQSSAVVWTQDPFSLRSYWRQNYRWSRAFWESVRRYRVGLCWFGVWNKPLRPSMLDTSAALMLTVLFLYGIALTLVPLLVIYPVSLDLWILTLDTSAEYALWLAMQYALVCSLVLLTGIEARRPWILLYAPIILVLIYVDILISTLALLAVTRSMYRRGISGSSSAWTSPARQPVAPRDLLS